MLLQNLLIWTVIAQSRENHDISSRNMDGILLESKLINELFAGYDSNTAPFASHCTNEDTFIYKVSITTIVQAIISNDL